MKLAHLASKLYPRWWRERYGDEFAALLDDARPGLGGAVDITKGAIAVQLTTWTPGRVLSVCVALGLTGAAATLALWPREYQSQVVFAVLETDSVRDAAERLTPLITSVLNRTSAAQIIDKYKLYPEERDRSAAMERFREKVRLTPAWPPESAKFEIVYEYPDPVIAQRVAWEISIRILDGAKTLDGVNRSVALVDPSTLPTQPNLPKTAKVFGIGIAASLLLGGLLALLVWSRTDEFAALLDDGRPGLAGAFDIAKGAITAQLTTWTPARTMAPCLVLGLTASVALLEALPRRFTSTSVLHPTAPLAAEEMTKQMNTALNSALDRTWVQSMIPYLKLFGDTPSQEDPVERFRREIHLTPVKNIVAANGPIDAVTVSYQHTDPRVAQTITKAVTTRIFYRLPPRQYSVLDPASQPTSPTFPNRLAILSLGFAVSLVTGGILAMIVRRKRARNAA